MRKSISIFLILITIIIAGSNSWAATGYARAYYQYNDYQNGAFHDIAAVVDTHLENMGYSSLHNASSAYLVRGVIGANNRKVIYMCGHSGPCFQGCEPGGVTYTLESGDDYKLYGLGNLTNVKLLYFCGCETGAYSYEQDGYMDLYAYYELGVDSTVAFNNTIYYTGSVNSGCHYFDNRMFYYMYEGYSVYNAKVFATIDLLAKGGGYYGTNSVYITGSNTVIN